MIRPYEIARMKIQTGDIYGTFSNALFSRIIRLFTKSKTSHTGVFIWIKNRLFCAEMMEGKGCVMTPASNRLTEDFFWGKMKSNYSQEEITENCLDDIGRLNYSMLGAILAPFISTKHSDNICSEWVAKVLGLDFDQLERGILPIDIMNKATNITLVTK